MADMTIKQKKEWARLLFTKENLTQEEIAERVGVSRVTVNKWINKEKWGQYKVSITLTREEQMKNLYRQLEEMDNAIKQRKAGERFASPAESDSIYKLSKAIKMMETELGVSEIMSSFNGLLDWLRAEDPEQARQIAPTLDAFIKSKFA
jgi:transcriptional regulator with XRE-family HTH domain